MSTETASITDSQFSVQINVWGRLTVGLGLILSLAAPIYLFTIEGLWPGWAPIFASLAAVALIFGANWIVEPATYFPMLGVAGTYQAWLVGNISNKLLPASVTAQGATDTKPGTKKAELISVAAMSGAVIVHIISMILLIAVLGNWIVSILPESIVATFEYILPAIVGAVFVQLAFVLKDFITMSASIIIGVFAVFFFVEWLPDLSALALPIVVIGTVAVALLSGSRKSGRQENEPAAHATSDLM